MTGAGVEYGPFGYFSITLAHAESSKRSAICSIILRRALRELGYDAGDLSVLAKQDISNTEK